MNHHAIYMRDVPRNINGFLPPYLLNELARLNPEHAGRYFDALKLTARCWSIGHSQVFPIGSGKADRRIYDAENKTRLPGTLAREEGEPAHRDDIINNCYDFAGAVRNYFLKVHKRNGIDGNGGQLICSVHYGRLYNNAFWNSRQMVFGDGDQEIFSTFVLMDIMGHELSHGVTENTSGLEYWKQSGALNEHCSDVFGEISEQYLLGQRAHDADWLVGKGLFMPGINGRALRDMVNPGTAYDDPKVGADPQPAHMDDYVDTTSDNGGVHYNSGIPNRAFALFARELGGYSWEKSGLIWFETLNRVDRRATFQDFANMTVKVAKANFSNTVATLRHSWKEVGLTAA